MLTFDAGPHVYFWNDDIVPGVTDVIRGAIGDPFERVAPEILEHARQRGTAVHKACELDDAGNLDEDSVDFRIRPYVAAWRKFRAQFRCEVVMAESALYSRVYGYAGTPDVVIELPNFEQAVVDRKTGLPGPAAALQTAAYQVLAQENGLRPTRRFALRMLPTGQYRFDEYKNAGDVRDFLACLAVHRLRERIAA